MLDIETKRYRMQSIGGGLVLITHKASGSSWTVSRDSLPSDHSLAMMSERAFNTLCDASN